MLSIFSCACLTISIYFREFLSVILLAFKSDCLLSHDKGSLYRSSVSDMGIWENVFSIYHLVVSFSYVLLKTEVFFYVREV